MHGLVLLVLLGTALGGWLIRNKKMKEIADAPLEPQQVSAVAGAGGLRDALSHLVLELDGGVEDRGVQTDGVGMSIGLGGGLSVSTGSPPHHRRHGPDVTASADVEARMRDAASAWNPLDVSVRDALVARGVDGELIEGLIERPNPQGDVEASQLATQLRSSLQAFSVPAPAGPV